MDCEEIFRCRVKLEGPSVIEGIKNLGKAGLASLPMKDHLGGIPSLAKNRILLRQRSNHGKAAPSQPTAKTPRQSTQGQRRGHSQVRTVDAPQQKAATPTRGSRRSMPTSHK